MNSKPNIAWDAAWDEKLGNLVGKGGRLLEEVMYQFPLEDDMARQCLRPLSSQTKAVRSVRQAPTTLVVKCADSGTREHAGRGKSCYQNSHIVFVLPNGV